MGYLMLKKRMDYLMLEKYGSGLKSFKIKNNI